MESAEILSFLSARTRIPDASLERYKIENFKCTNAKRVRFEELDFNIYKSSANHVDFSTTENRVQIWIKALYFRYYKNDDLNNTEINTRWLEQENQINPSKCDKVLLSIHANENENVLTIIVNVSTGRIQAQGRLFKEWGAKEFDHLLAMVNTSEDTWKTDNMKPFMEIILRKERNSHQPTHITEKKQPVLLEDSTTPVTSRDKTNNI